MSTDKNRGEWPSRELAKIAGADDWGKVKGGDHQDLSLGFDRSVISGIKYNHNNINANFLFIKRKIA